MIWKLRVCNATATHDKLRDGKLCKEMNISALKWPGNKEGPKY
jgi:hypothetical protein